MMTLALIAGIWTTTCIQTQISNVNQGFVKETYSIEKNGSFEFKRQWFRDSKCEEQHGTDSESGTVDLGKKIQGFFITHDTYEANFSTQGGLDLGAISPTSKSIKVARGVRNSSLRNTMLSLFEYHRQ